MFLVLMLTVAFLPQTITGQTENLLLNGNFEEGFSAWNGDEQLQVATGWNPFWVIEGLDIPENSSGNRPEFMASNAPQSPFSRAYEGQQSQLWHTKFSTAFAGIYQRVPIAPATTIRLSAWSYAWSSEGNDPTISQGGAWVRQRVGIDPTGGTDPNSPNIAWSMPTQYLDSWGQISVETQAQTDHVTVFLAAYPNFHLPQNDIYFDNAELRLVSFGLATPASGSNDGTGFGEAAATVDPSLVSLVLESETVPGQQGLTLHAEDLSHTVSVTNVSLQENSLIPILVLGLVLSLALLGTLWITGRRDTSQ